MRKIALAFLLCASSALLGQASAPTPPPSPVPAFFLTHMKDLVVIIELQCVSDKKIVYSSGTGFFVVGSEEKKISAYLVTNRHVAECWNHLGKSLEVKSIRMRMNLLNGLSEVELLNGNGNAPWILPADKSIDLAVLPIYVTNPNFQVMALSPEDFATDDMFTKGQIHEGQSIIFTGIFPKIAGRRRNQPILREGIISSLAEEPIDGLNGVPSKYFLGDVHVVAGNSGSPVMVDLAGRQGSSFFAGEKYKLLGVVNGYLTEDADMSLKMENTIETTVSANSGITTIVPVSDLRELLNDSRVLNVSGASVTKLAPEK